MKKSIVALAVSSAALASISAYAADDASVSYYGNIQYAYVSSNPDTAGQVSTHDFADNGSSLGFKGESKVSDSSTAFFNVKYKVNAATGGAKNITLDNAFVGVKGNFGSLKTGSFDSIYNDAIQDAINQFEYIGLEKSTTSTEGKTIAYFSPMVSGFQLQLSAGLGVQTANSAGTAVDTKTKTATTAVLKYSNDMVTVALGYDGLQNKDTAGVDSVTAGNELSSTTGMIVTFKGVQNLSVSANYEKTKDASNSQAGHKSVGLAARYGYGMGDVYGSVQKVDQDKASATDYTEYAAGVTYSINSSMYTYIELGRFGSDKTAQSVLGVTYSF